MDEYIKKETLIEDFKSCGASKDIVDAIIYRINQHQPADVVEVRHGKWKTIDFYNGFARTVVECSVCKCAETGSIGTNYCPNCGAKMDGETKSL